MPVTNIPALALLLGGVLLLGACGQTATDRSAPAPATLSAVPSGASAQAVTPVSLSVGQTQQLTVYVSGRPATPSDVTWRSSNTGVATVSDGGLVSAKAAGSAAVRVSLRSNAGAYIDFPVTVSATGSAPTPGTGATDFEKRVLDLTNQARASARVCGTQSFAATGPLAFNANLRTAAYNHSRDMALNNYFSHTGLNGSTPWDRMTAAGYTNYRAAGENIAAGQSTPEAVVAGWLKSSGHCANIMNPAFKELGVGYFAGGSYGHYWTQDFGAR